MAWFALVGLILEIVGTGLLIRDDVTALAARIRQSRAEATENLWVKSAFWLARRFGSIDPQGQENYTGEAFSMRLLGFFFLLGGFIVQAIGIVIYLLWA